MMGNYDEKNHRQQAGKRTLTEGIATPITPGKRTLTQDLAAPVQRADVSAPASDASTEAEHEPSAALDDGQVNPEDSKPRDKGKAQTENVDGGTLWAKDETGKDLPPSIEDISQGGAGDCWVFAAMAAIVHSNPLLIKGMIHDNGNGSYTVTFHGTGVFSSNKHTVTAANFIKRKHGNLTARKALWPLIIEKAYIAEKGGLDEVEEGGSPGGAVDDFVAKGATRFAPADKEPSWILARLARAQAARKPTTMFSPNKKDASKVKKAMSDEIPGLIFNHAYAVIGVDEKGKRVQLFNPWGREHPGGDGWLDIKDVRAFFFEVDING